MQTTEERVMGKDKKVPTGVWGPSAVPARSMHPNVSFQMLQMLVIRFLAILPRVQFNIRGAEAGVRVGCDKFLLRVLMNPGRRFREPMLHLVKGVILNGHHFERVEDHREEWGWSMKGGRVTGYVITFAIKENPCAAIPDFSTSVKLVFGENADVG